MPFAPDKRSRVIINTDAKNEADDQYAIVHGLLTPTGAVPTLTICPSEVTRAALVLVVP